MHLRLLLDNHCRSNGLNFPQVEGEVSFSETRCNPCLSRLSRLIVNNAQIILVPIPALTRAGQLQAFRGSTRCTYYVHKYVG